MEQSKEQKYQIHLATRQPFDPTDEEPDFNPRKAAHYIVQFVKPLTLEEQKRLKAMYHLQLKYYVPNFAFLEWLEPQTWKALTQDKLYRSSLPYEARDKISPHRNPSLDGKAPHIRAVLFPESDYRDIVEVIIALRNKSVSTENHEGYGKRVGSRADADQIRVFDDRKSGGNLQIVFPPLSGEALSIIAQREEVRWIEEVSKVILDAPAITELTPAGIIQSGQVGLTPIWDKGIAGEGQVIGVTDEQLHLGHCMFHDPDGNLVGPTHRKVVGSRQGTGLSDPHGDEVAGLAAGVDFNRSAESRKKGMAWQARLSLDEIESGTYFSKLHNQASDGAFIHTNSWHEFIYGGAAYNQTAFEVDNFVSINEEHFVCGSSGNSGERLGPPGIAKNALCVSGSKRTEQGMNVGDGVSGPVSFRDQRRKPEICAPGCGFEVAIGGDGRCDTSLTSDSECASSWATAIMAGAAALVRQYYVEGWYPGGAKCGSDCFAPSGALIKATLLNSTVDMTPVGYPTDKEGWGLVRLSNTLFFDDEADSKLFVRDIRSEAGLQTGESHTYTINVKDDSRPLKITLVWSDSPALPNARHPLVNDLDLIVTSPDNKRYFGNNFDENGLSVEDTQTDPVNKTDTINNVEMVIRKQDLQGIWTITVSGTAVHDSTKPQGYALVATATLN